MAATAKKATTTAKKAAPAKKAPAAKKASAPANQPAPAAPAVDPGQPLKPVESETWPEGNPGASAAVGTLTPEPKLKAPTDPAPSNEGEKSVAMISPAGTRVSVPERMADLMPGYKRA